MKCIVDYNVEVVDKSYDGILIMKLIHKISNVVILLCVGYLPPENSVWGRDASSFYEHLVSNIYIHSDADYFIICGDLNSRFGNEKDFIPDIDDIMERNILDTGKNQHGQCLLEFLLETKFGVVNGRITPDNDSFTNVSHKGR